MAKFRYLQKPFTLKGLSLKNRIVMPPMCQYQAVDGVPNDWHFVHYTSRAIGGVGLVIVEMTNIAPNGRISPKCLGLWNDNQRDEFAKIVASVHKYDAKIAIQIAHAGRKAEDCDDVVAPSAIHYGDLDFKGQNLKTPRALSTTEIDEIVDGFVKSVQRAIDAGFDAIELHGAHGYLIHQFHAPKSNQRDDEYGQDRFLFGEKVIKAVKAVMPSDMPLIMRISAQEYGENGYDSDYGVEIAKRYVAAGVDMLHISGGGDGVLAVGHYPEFSAGYQVFLASKIKHATNVPTIAVGMLDNPQLADNVLARDADLVAVGRGLLRDPHWWLNAQYNQVGADFDGVNDVPDSYERGYF
ncbi:NADH:flavin oxidoreductase/NADH oxidase [Faucicola boevrei]|uniref:NADH:flavin oxidoreductase/NADH oxidase n=1 Tax=Faucicola boevrei TaxID=346665 RepID=UPI000370976B|nr:NADH:flavin oxidoreductase/NADH oxidase [Moraxella boevrei]